SEFAQWSRANAPDLLAFYEDHLLLIGNPARGAGTGELLKLLGNSITGRKARITPHSRTSYGEITSIELVQGRPGWDVGALQFVRMESAQGDLWFWAQLPVVTDEELTQAVDHVVRQIAS